jgi:mannose-6-phosphate isomerase-like protein (cupin superfamily)
MTAQRRRRVRPRQIVKLKAFQLRARVAVIAPQICSAEQKGRAMQVMHLQFGAEFHVALGNARSQAATMVIAPGDSEGDADNHHRAADQWLYVVSGTGEAIVEGKHHPLRAGSLILIEHGEHHEIKNLGRIEMKTVNFYVPPAFSKDGTVLPAGKPGE